ncbi:MAG: hypothetical protein JXA30_03715 [Deltaproteobacteria bacterium]|nr:hypothetical protein [Deltaproteobacteria bacterium]
MNGFLITPERVTAPVTAGLKPGSEPLAYKVQPQTPVYVIYQPYNVRK